MFPFVISSPFEVPGSPSSSFDVRLDLCMSDSKSNERRAFFCGGGDSPPCCSSSDEARVTENSADSQVCGNISPKANSNRPANQNKTKTAILLRTGLHIVNTDVIYAAFNPQKTGSKLRRAIFGTI